MDDSPNPSFASRVGERSQAVNVTLTQSGTGFHLDAYQMPGRVFQHDVYVLSRSCAPVEELRLGIAPGRLLFQFHQNKAFQYAAYHSRIYFQPLQSEPLQMREQASVIQIDFWRPDKPLPQVARPRL